MADRHFNQPAHRPALNVSEAVRRFIVLLFACNALAASAAERVLPDYKSLDELPPPVLAAFKPMADECEWHISQLMVQSFGNEILWSVRCASNHANQKHTYVIASDEKGTNAKALRFPVLKRNSPPLDTISNAIFDEGRRAITSYFFDPEEPPCRIEATWRVEEMKPALIFWREARRCEGEGWAVKLDQRKKR